jgi:hypothetical protein
MLFNIPFVADWKQIRDYRQHQTDRSNKCENDKRVDYDYKVGGKILIQKDGILPKAESIWKKEPWTITTVIRMELSGFNAEPNRKELISGE